MKTKHIQFFLLCASLIPAAHGQMFSSLGGLLQGLTSPGGLFATGIGGSLTSLFGPVQDVFNDGPPEPFWLLGPGRGPPTPNFFGPGPGIGPPSPNYNMYLPGLPPFLQRGRTGRPPPYMSFMDDFSDFIR